MPRQSKAKRYSPPSAPWLLLAAIFVICLAPARATEWQNPSGGEFDDSDNWTAGVPDENSFAGFLLDASYEVMLEGSHTVGGFDINKGDVRFRFSGTLSVTMFNPIIGGDREGSARFELVSGTISSTRKIQFGEGRDRFLVSDGAEVIAPLLDVGTPEENLCELRIAPGGVVRTNATIYPNSTLEVGGTFDGDVINGGVFRGSGDIALGDYTQQDSGRLELEVRGPGGDHDRLVCDQATFAGELVLRFVPTYEPRVGDQFAITECNSQAQNFDEGIRLEGLSPNVVAATFQEAGRFIVILVPGSPIPIALDVPQQASISRAGYASDYVFTAPRDMVVRVSLDDPGAGENSLYARVGDVASAVEFDAAADARGRSDQSVAFRLVEGAELFLRARANKVPEGSENSVTVLVEELDLDLQSSSATYSGASADRVSATLIGEGFVQNATFSLEHRTSALVLPTEAVQIVASDRAEVVFDLGAAVLGDYDIVANAAGVKARLTSAFEVRDDDSAASLVVELVAVDRYRKGRTGRLALIYRNEGAEELRSPLLRLRGPAGTRLKLSRDDEFSRDPLYVLALQPNGYPGTLAPGRSGELAVFFQNSNCKELSCPLAITVERLVNADVPVSWDSIARPQGVNEIEWQGTWPALSRELGATWAQFATSLSELSGPVSHRGRDAASAVEVFRFAFAESSRDRQNGALIGVAIDAATGRRLANRPIGAVLDGTIVQLSTTDEEGSFAIEGLERGREYELQVERATVTSCRGCSAANSVTVPFRDSELSAIEVRTEEAKAPRLACAGCVAAPDVGFLTLPDDVFAPVAVKNMTIVSSFDPNEKQGPGESGDEIPPTGNLLYTVYFENLPRATAAAQEIVINDDIDLDLDLSEAEFVGGAIGDTTF
ncbi:MAG: hypothetical protein AAF517_14355, partial [Planctomycetota bacterium]